MDMRAVLGEDAVDTKRNRLTTARAKQLVVHSHKNSNAIGELETRVQSENFQLASGTLFLTSIPSVVVTSELCLEHDTSNR